MLSTVGGMEMSMSQDCPCDSDSAMSESCEAFNCTTCVYNGSTAVITDTYSITVPDLSLPTFQYLLVDTPTVYSRMLRPPKAV